MSVKSPAGERLRPSAWDALIVLCVAAAAVLLLIALRPAEGGRLTAEVALDGRVVARFELDRLDRPEKLELDAPYPLTVEVQPGRIRISESECPGGDCVHTGWISRAGSQMICLPNRLVIAVTGDAHQEFDAVTG